MSVSRHFLLQALQCVTELIDNDNDGIFLSFDDCVIEHLIIRSFNVEKPSSSECSCSLWAMLVRVIFFPALNIFF